MKRTKVKALSNRNRVSNLGNDKAKIKAKGSAKVKDKAKVMNNGVVILELNSRIKVKTKKGSRRKTVLNSSLKAKIWELSSLPILSGTSLRRSAGRLGVKVK